jgi:vancomycin resistance protein YoaR
MLKSTGKKSWKNYTSWAGKGSWKSRYKQIEEIRENKVQAETTLTMDITRIRGAVEEIAESLSVEPVNADLSFHPGEEQMFRITPEQEGRKVDSDELYRSVEEIFKSGQPGIVAIEPAVVEPEVRAADLERATSKIVTFSTSMSGSSENRMSNIALALRKINGTKLNPGEVFSFNQVVGNRTAKAGFQTCTCYYAG